MEDKLDFSLPEKKKSASSAFVAVLLLLIAVALGAGNLFVTLRGPSQTAGTSPQDFSADQTRQLATKLAQRDLYLPAAKVWQDYLVKGELTDDQRAQALFQAATMLKKAGRYEDAIEQFYRSEMTSKIDDLTPAINTHIRDCFQRLGKFSALRYEMMDRTSLKDSQPAGGNVVAEIGAEKITEAELDAVIESQIDNQLAPMAAFMTPEQVNQQKERMLAEFKSPQTRQQILQMHLAQEILYRQGLEEGLAETDAVKRLLEDLSRQTISQHLISRELADKINITETDLQTYYKANSGDYVEPATVQISHIVSAEKSGAEDIIEKLEDGGDFAEMAKTDSIDDATRENGGRIDTPVSKGSYVPVIGDNKELNGRIFAAKKGALLVEPVESEAGWHVVRVEGKTEARQKGFDEVSGEVMTTLSNKKRQDVQQAYIQQLMEKYDVVIHTSAFAPATPADQPQLPAGHP